MYMFCQRKEKFDPIKILSSDCSFNWIEFRPWRVLGLMPVLFCHRLGPGTMETGLTLRLGENNTKVFKRNPIIGLQRFFFSWIIPLMILDT